MGQTDAPADLQEAVDRSYRMQWGGKRFCLTTAIVLFVLAMLSALAVVLAPGWFGENKGALKVVEVSGLTTSFVCLVAAVLFGMGAIMRAQRELGELPDRTIHAALSLSLVTVAGLLFLFFLSVRTWGDSGMSPTLVRAIRFIVFLFSGMAWFCAIVMNSAGITKLLTRRSDLLEVNNTKEGTSVLFRKGHSHEIAKLCVGMLIPLIIFVIGLMTVGVDILFGGG